MDVFSFIFAQKIILKTRHFDNGTERMSNIIVLIRSTFLLKYVSNIADDIPTTFYIAFLSALLRNSFLTPSTTIIFTNTIIAFLTIFCSIE